MNIKSLKRIAIFASGTGTNAANIITYFKQKKTAEVVLIVCNNPQAGVLKIAADNHIDSLVVQKEKFFKGDGYLPELQTVGVDFIVLAGFLWKVPSAIIHAYRNNIINIHPALLPRHGGKGMYGHFVHEAVLSAKEKESGITIHFVDEFYDNGKTILQVNCPVYESDTTETLAKRIHALEYEYFPRVIEELVENHN
jgi:phosphoribosylglycinamide formyltransferase-1